MALPSPDAITNEEFTALLDEYPSLVETISKSKGSKSGQKSLQQLDEYRYGKAIQDFGSADSTQEMTLDNLKLLVEWKLRHGKFRPMLMGLAASNNPTVAKKIIAEAIATYRAGSSPPSDKTIATTLAMLAKLRGIGPATASLLLTVHDPTRVIFFSDEVFYWLCCEGRVDKIKYTNPEYERLREEAGIIMARLRVSATDVEKVAYVLFKRNGGAAAAASSSGAATTANPSAKVTREGQKKEEIEKQGKIERLEKKKEKKEQDKKKVQAKKKADAEKKDQDRKEAAKKPDEVNTMDEDKPKDAKSAEPRPAKRKSTTSERPYRPGSRQSKRVKK